MKREHCITLTNALRLGNKGSFIFSIKQALIKIIQLFLLLFIILEQNTFNELSKTKNTETVVPGLFLE